MDIFDEIGEDMRAERARVLLRRFGPLLAGLVVLVLLGVGGWQVWRGRQAEQAGQVAEAYLDATKQAERPGEPQVQAADALEALAGTAPEGYRTLARLREAGIKAGAGDVPGALALWDAVAGDGQADQLLRDLANLLWVQHQVDAGDPAQVEGRLAGLIGPGNPWAPLAREERALLLLRTKQDDKAKEVLRGLRDDVRAPDGVRGRAAGLLTLLGDPAPAQAGGTGG